MNDFALPGAFGLSVIGGRTGALIAAGQAILGDGSRFTHAFMVLDNGEIIEAMPQGARIIKLSERADDLGGIVISDAPVRNFVNKAILPAVVGAREEYEKTVRKEVVRLARMLEGTKYNFLDYVYLSLARLGIEAKWLRNRVSTSDHLICSQLVDEVYNRAGIHLFDDGRLPMDVTPGDLDIWRIANG